jgi:ABC-2 type transport system ATP-binding protein
LNEVEQVCDGVAILSKGQLIAQGAVSSLVQSGEQVLLRTTDDAQAVAILSALEWVGEVAREDTGLVVHADTSRSWELTAALSQCQVYVKEMTTGQLSLERYFLDVTGDNPEGAQQ